MRRHRLNVSQTSTDQGRLPANLSPDSRYGVGESLRNLLIQLFYAESVFAT
jgi:hypothetical protein